MGTKQRILIVDDSPFIRRMLNDWITKQPDLEVVGQAGDGAEGARLCKELKPDVVTMDIEMPKCSGIDALKMIMRDSPTNVLMVSSLTKEGAVETLRSLELGAYDFVTKPGGSHSLRFVSSEEEILTKIRSAHYVKRGSRAATSKAPVAAAPKFDSNKVIAIASSTGGPQALVQLWETLPKGLNVPILMVQHMPEGFTHSLANRLTRVGTVPCVEAADGQPVEKGVAFLAPGGKHMIIDQHHRLRLLETPAMHGVRPAADILFASMVDVFGSRIVGAILTGMGRDGAEGALKIKTAGGVVFGQSESSCTIYGMPKAAKEAGAITAEFPVNELAHAIIPKLGDLNARAA